ncbi:MAG TPA: zinc-binding dehydrogenase, partial [Amaricoccus sp.]|nr:zinc-binding dehydrogenase [Amaricoccus sp.]
LARLRPGETLLVSGAAGGVGLTAVEIGALLGARVLAVARGAEKRATAMAAGACETFDAAEDFAAAVKALGGADVVYETVGGALFDRCLAAARAGARLLPIGFAGGEVPKVPANRLLVKNQTVIGFYFGAWVRSHPEAARGSLEALMAWHAMGRLKPHVSHVVPLEAANDGLRLIATRAATGKVVVRVAA